MKKILACLLIVVLFSAQEVCAKKEKWKEHKAQHFRIYYKNAPLDFVNTVEQMSEQYYSTITKNLGFTRYVNWSFDRRAKIYICDDKEDYIRITKQARWSHGVAYLKNKEIITFPSAHGFFDTTLPHELGHIIFREFVGFHTLLPLWLDEGVAMYQEKAKRWGANDAVKKSIKSGTFIPLGELTKMGLYANTPQETVNLYYAEAASVVYFMITELGDYRFVRFCRKLKKGATFKTALKSVYVRFRTIDDLNRSWLRYLE